jgi:hypothetical protein
LLADGQQIQVPLATKHTIATAVLDSVVKSRTTPRP